MGSGKSLLGKKVAQLMDVTFMEMDELIEKEAGCEIKDIFKHDGEAYFRSIERKILDDIIDKASEAKDTIIVSTGGGAPCFNDNLQRMKENGVVVYIRPSEDILLSRLVNGMDHRPLLRGKTENELRTYIRDTLTIREPYYKGGDWIFNPVFKSKTSNILFLKKLIQRQINSI